MARERTQIEREIKLAHAQRDQIISEVAEKKRLEQRRRWMRKAY